MAEQHPLSAAEQRPETEDVQGYVYVHGSLPTLVPGGLFDQPLPGRPPVSGSDFGVEGGGGSGVYSGSSDPTRSF